jgi:hypothetical protein
MTGLIAFIKSHPTAFVLGLYYFASAFVGSLPMPAANSSMLYRFFFQFSNTLAANVMRAYSSKLPATVSDGTKP